MAAGEAAERRAAGGTGLNPAGCDIILSGRVQGVGMRPAVYRLARRLGLRGRVWNEGGRVRIQIWGEEAVLAAFVGELRQELPFQAVIDAVRRTPLEALPPADFRIDASRPAEVAAVPPDVAVCPDCLRELFDPGDHRYRYPFIHCTRCGPRFAVIRRLPYDRENTSLVVFPLCRHCRQEYTDSEDRRFHAETIACPACGPRVWTRPESATEPIDQATAWLREGKIVAVKGVGGFQLMADATRTEAVECLRLRKHRPHKPLALMARDLAVVRRYCRLGEAEVEALQAPEAPVVLLEATGSQGLPRVIAPGLGRLGFVLPYSPLHHLLLEPFDTPLVFTSANVSGAPLCADNDEALFHLADIADAFLLHDRAVVHRCDDSVVQQAAGRIRVLRRARGYAPASLPLPPGFGQVDGVLALGGELKAAFCLLHRGQAILSQHLGDLEDARSFAWFREELVAYQGLFGFRPRVLAVDLHPEYLSTKWGRRWAEADGLVLRPVQHHHAHLAACLAEYGHPLTDAPVLGLILDGLGYGADGGFWGGELLLGGYRRCRRLARLRPAPLPGGARAMTEPWRNLVARLWQSGLDADGFPSLGDKPVAALVQMLERGLNCPPASSCGRLFDAVAAALGICCDRQSFEGQAAMYLEALAWRSDDAGVYPFGASAAEIDPGPLWPKLLADLRAGRSPETIARRFHNGLVSAWVRMIERWSGRVGCRTVVLSGGVFQNRLLLEAMQDRLEALGFQVWIPERVPMNDGGLSLGQALIAAANSGV